jgi:hypothetical protein
MPISDEERERRRELARKLHKEGKFGGKQEGAGRPKKARAQEAVADRIAQEGETIFLALEEALSSDSPSVKLKAALAMLDIENKEVDHQRKVNQDEFEDATKEELIAFITTTAQKLKEAGITLFNPGLEESRPLRVEADSITIEGSLAEGSDE